MPFRPIKRMPVPAEHVPTPRVRVRLPSPAPSAAVSKPEARVGSLDYTVGYAKPPEHSRFRPGQSGNPRGRPKGAKGMNRIARDLLTEKVSIRTPTGTKKVSKMEATLHKLMEKAFAGDIRAQTALIQLYRTSVPEEVVTAAPGANNNAATRTEQDEAALAALYELVRDEIDGASDEEAA